MLYANVFPVFVNYIFLSNYFILVRVMMDPEPIPGMLGRRMDYNLDGIPVNYIAQYMHTFTPRDN